MSKTSIHKASEQLNYIMKKGISTDQKVNKTGREIDRLLAPVGKYISQMSAGVICSSLNCPQHYSLVQSGLEKWMVNIAPELRYQAVEQVYGLLENGVDKVFSSIQKSLEKKQANPSRNLTHEIGQSLASANQAQSSMTSQKSTFKNTRTP